MRGTIDGLPSRHRLVALLPALYAGDDLANRLCAALDEVLAPVFLTLDDLQAYIDPALAPPDFLDWVASWVGAEPSGVVEDLDRRRELVRDALPLYALRGTPGALRRILELVTGVAVEVDDSGGCVASAETGTELPGGPPYLRVRIAGRDVDEELVRRTIEAWKPAHVPYELA